MESETYVTIVPAIKLLKSSFNLNAAPIKYVDSFALIGTSWSAKNVRNGITKCVKIYLVAAKLIGLLPLSIDKYMYFFCHDTRKIYFVA